MAAWQEIKELHRQTTLGAKEGVAFRYFSRPLASFTLYLIKDSRITPNQITIMSLIVGMGGFATYMFRLDHLGLILGTALFMLAHVLDALDGQLARHRKAGSVIGMHFDFFIDELKAYALYISIAYRLYLMQSAGGDSTPRFLGELTSRFDAPGILVTALVGLCGLCVGISCTQFMKLKEWKEAFVPAVGSGGSPSFVARMIGLVEKGGRFVVDYPSYIIILSVINMMELYFIGYTIVVCLYAARSLFGISLKLWRVNPYD